MNHATPARATVIVQARMPTRSHSARFSREKHEWKNDAEDHHLPDLDAGVEGEKGAR